MKFHARREKERKKKKYGWMVGWMDGKNGWMDG